MQVYSSHSRNAQDGEVRFGGGTGQSNPVVSPLRFAGGCADRLGAGKLPFGHILDSCAYYRPTRLARRSSPDVNVSTSSPSWTARSNGSRNIPSRTLGHFRSNRTNASETRTATVQAATWSSLRSSSRTEIPSSSAARDSPITPSARARKHRRSKRLGSSTSGAKLSGSS